MKQVLILGCGYTGRRVALRLLDRGIPVVATTRNPSKLEAIAARGATVIRVDVLDPGTLGALRVHAADGAAVVHSIPVIETAAGLLDPTPALLEALQRRPSRMVYLSTTGVYGVATDVDENTAPSPANESDRLRIAAEQAVASGGWSALTLRPAAIYGPGRGVHESIRRARYRLVGDGGNYVSRIHVDDLAAIVEAALFSSITGAYPVADDEPSTALEMARFCAELTGAPLPPSVGTHDVHHTRRANRRVDGRAILRLLGVRLLFPSYRTGVPASLQAPVL
ncbi:MAG: NAD(P)H-binding protein [Bryobacteraceae bacterium]|nr:NAD(P)H-binding protein [Bryobacteraceae bacterium]